MRMSREKTIVRLAGKASVLCFGLLVTACSAPQDGPLGPRPIAGPFHSEFRASQLSDDNRFSPFIAATLAQRSDNQRQSADFYIDAYNAAPDSEFVADRAFSQALLAGRLDDAEFGSRQRLQS